jgi:hypothetical protein
MKPLNLLGLVFIFTFMAVLSHAEVSTSILGLWGVKNLDDKNLQEHSEMVEGGLEARSKIKFASCLDQSTHLNISSNFMSYEVDGFVCVLPNGKVVSRLKCNSDFESVVSKLKCSSDFETAKF